MGWTWTVGSGGNLTEGGLDTLRSLLGMQTRLYQNLARPHGHEGRLAMEPPSLKPRGSLRIMSKFLALRTARSFITRASTSLQNMRLRRATRPRLRAPKVGQPCRQPASALTSTSVAPTR